MQATARPRVTRGASLNAEIATRAPRRAGGRRTAASFGPSRLGCRGQALARLGQGGFSCRFSLGFSCRFLISFLRVVFLVLPRVVFLWVFSCFLISFVCVCVFFSCLFSLVFQGCFLLEVPAVRVASVSLWCHWGFSLYLCHL